MHGQKSSVATNEIAMREVLATGLNVWENGRKQRDLIGMESPMLTESMGYASSVLIYCQPTPCSDLSIAIEGKNFVF